MERRMPTATLVIVTFNSSDALPACAQSLHALTVDGGYELIVVDNDSHDDSIAVVRQHLPHAQLITNTMNRGFAAAVNQGIAAGSGRIVATLNPDTVVASDWLQSLIMVLDADPTIGIVGSAIRDFAGTLTHTGGDYHPLTFHTTHHDAPNDMLSEVPYVTGAGIAMRRTDWQQVEGFDEGFFPAYFEDVDLCIRVRALGLRCVYQPHAQLHHQESSSTGKYSGPFYFFYHRNRIRLALRSLDTHTLLHDFVMAEADALSRTDVIDRLIALSCYRHAMPQTHDGAPRAAAQQAILTMAQHLKPIRAEHRHRPHTLPDDVLAMLGVDRMRMELYHQVYGAPLPQHEPDAPQVNQLNQPLYQLLYGTERMADVRVRLVGNELVQFIEQLIATRNTDVFWQTHHISRLTSEITYLRHVISLSDVVTIENTIRSTLTSHLLSATRSTP
jgi:GT2 family glycosyltransferase